MIDYVKRKNFDQLLKDAERCRISKMLIQIKGLYKLRVCVQSSDKSKIKLQDCHGSPNTYYSTKIPYRINYNYTTRWGVTRQRQKDTID